jgi:hypothetical protein
VTDGHCAGFTFAVVSRAASDAAPHCGAGSAYHHLSDAPATTHTYLLPVPSTRRRSLLPPLCGGQHGGVSVWIWNKAWWSSSLWCRLAILAYSCPGVETAAFAVANGFFSTPWTPLNTPHPAPVNNVQWWTAVHFRTCHFLAPQYLSWTSALLRKNDARLYWATVRQRHC